MTRSNTRLDILFFLISGLVHIALLVSFQYMQGDKTPPVEEVAELEIIMQDQQTMPQMVQAPPSPKKEQPEPKDKANFLSSQTQRVELESWKKPQQTATVTADTGSQQSQQNSKKETQTEEPEGSTDVSDDGDFYAESDRKPLLLPGFSSASSPPKIPSYIQQRLPPGVRLGNVTALNTDQHQFYSFNQRLLSRFVPNWGNMVGKALYKWLQDNNYPPVSKSWVTNVEVIMNKKGEIIDVQPFRLSGFWKIDEAPIKAFKMVKNVPNPPAGMVDENGYIHIQFQTEVLWVPQPGMRMQSNQPGQRSN